MRHVGAATASDVEEMQLPNFIGVGVGLVLKPTICFICRQP